jgi:hypothetical protein
LGRDPIEQKASVVTLSGSPASCAAYAVLELALPAGPIVNIGVLLLDVSNDKLYLRLRPNLEELAGPDEGPVLALLEDDFKQKAAEMGGEAFLSFLEDTLSNVLRVTERQPTVVSDFRRELEILFNRYVRVQRAASA